MAVEVVNWVFAHSRSKNAGRLVMLAVADACRNPDGTGAFLSNVALRAKTNLSERAVQAAVAVCEAAGELKVRRGGGRGGVNEFVVVMTPGNPAESAPFTETPQNLPPAESAGGRSEEGPQVNGQNPAESAPKAADGNPAESAPGTVRTYKNSSTKSSSETSRPKRRRSAEPDRADVTKICQHLADRLVANGCKRPTITDRWRREARLLLDEPRDPPLTVGKVIALIDWCQQDSFWAPNVQSMSKFREKYDTLRMRALDEYKQGRNEQGRRNGGLGNNRHQPYLDPEDHSVYHAPL